MSSGTVRTASVVGRYWISSKTSVRKTTDPGVAARSSPTVKASGSTIDGTPGGVVGEVASPPPDPLAGAPSAGVDGRLQRQRVEHGHVAGGQRVDDVGGSEA